MQGVHTSLFAQPYGQHAASRCPRVEPECVRPRRRARGPARKPHRLTRDDRLPRQPQNEQHDRQQRHELDARLAALVSYPHARQTGDCGVTAPRRDCYESADASPRSYS